MGPFKVYNTHPRFRRTWPMEKFIHLAQHMAETPGDSKHCFVCNLRKHYPQVFPSIEMYLPREFPDGTTKEKMAKIDHDRAVIATQHSDGNSVSQGAQTVVKETAEAQCQTDLVHLMYVESKSSGESGESVHISTARPSRPVITGYHHHCGTVRNSSTNNKHRSGNAGSTTTTGCGYHPASTRPGSRRRDHNQSRVHQDSPTVSTWHSFHSFCSSNGTQHTSRWCLATPVRKPSGNTGWSTGSANSAKTS